MSRRLAVGLLAIVAVVSVFSAFDVSDDARPTPAPSLSASITAAPRAEIVAYARTLEFNTAHWASETDYLLIREADGRYRRGALATISPEIGALGVSHAQLETGIIISRVIAEDAVPEHGYGAGTNYIWFDKIATGWRLIVIPEDASVPITIKKGKVNHYGMPQGAAPLARFIMEEVWTQCSGGCCGVAGNP